MSVICKNCEQTFTGNFCHNCGQEASTHKINLHFMWHDIQHGFLHMDKGVLYTFKELFTRPGYTIREFIEGKRINHFKPISLVIILSTIYGFLYHHFHISEVPEINESSTYVSKNNLSELNEFIGTHMYLFQLLTIPLFSIGSFVVFYKQGYNFMEHLIMNAYLAGQRLFLIILTFPVLLYFNQTHHLKNLTVWSLLINLGLLFWAFSQVFNRRSKIQTFILTFTTYLIFWVLFFVMVSIAVAITLFIK